MRILRLPEVKSTLGHRADESVYAAIRDGLFPTGVAIGQRAKGWPDYEVQAIAAARIAGKSDEQIRQLVKALHADRATLSPPMQSAPVTQPTPSAPPSVTRRGLATA